MRSTAFIIGLQILLLALVAVAWADPEPPASERDRSVRWGFALSAPVDALLVRQALPAGVSVVLSSSLLGETPIADPRVAADGAALWLLTPEALVFDLRFKVLGTFAGADLPRPEAVALSGSREISLAGDLQFATWFELDPEEPEVRVPLAPWVLWNLQGSLGVRSLGTPIPVVDLGVRVYAEGTFGVNAWQAAINRQLDWRAGEGWSGRSAWNATPSDRFPLLGTSAIADYALRSADGVAFRFSRPGLAIAYLSDAVKIPGVDGSVFLDAARAAVDVAEGLSLELFAGLVAPDVIRETIVPDGTRRYLLRATPARGSERVVRVVRDAEGEVVGEVDLEPLRDYTIDRLVGMLVLSRTEWATNPLGQTVRLEVRYAAPDAPRTEVSAGVGARYQHEGWNLEVGAARTPDPAGGLGLRFGVRAGHAASGWSLDLQHVRPGGGSPETRWRLASSAQAWLGGEGSLTLQGWGGAAPRAEMSVALAWPAERLSVDARVQVARNAPLGFSVQARYELDAFSQIRVSAGSEGGSLNVALGGGYRSERFSLATDLRYSPSAPSLRLDTALSATLGGVEVTLLNEQALIGDQPSQTSVRAATRFGDTELNADLRVAPGGAPRATFAVTQAIGAGSLSAEMSTPVGAGEDAHLRFGVRSPWPGVAGLQLEADVGVEGQLWEGDVGYAGSVMAGYVGPSLSARLGVDVAWREAWKGTLAAQLAGSFGASLPQHLELDVRWTFAPDWRLYLVGSYALHAGDLSILAYQRVLVASAGWAEVLANIGRTELEGELVASWRAMDALRVRPALAYRFDSADPKSLLIQGGFGVTLYPLRQFGVGAVVYHSWQPAFDLHSTAYGGEAALALTDSLTLVGGYTGGSGPSLLPGSGEGWHLRLDVHGGTP